MATPSIPNLPGTWNAPKENWISQDMPAQHHIQNVSENLSVAAQKIASTFSPNLGFVLPATRYLHKFGSARIRPLLPDKDRSRKSLDGAAFAPEKFQQWFKSDCPTDSLTSVRKRILVGYLGSFARTRIGDGCFFGATKPTNTQISCQMLVKKSNNPKMCTTRANSSIVYNGETNCIFSLKRSHLVWM